MIIPNTAAVAVTFTPDASACLLPAACAAFALVSAALLANSLLFYDTTALSI